MTFTRAFIGNFPCEKPDSGPEMTFRRAFIGNFPCEEPDSGPEMTFRRAFIGNSLARSQILAQKSAFERQISQKPPINCSETPKSGNSDPRNPNSGQF
jgi:hypothetical protein